MQKAGCGLDGQCRIHEKHRQPVAPSPRGAIGTFSSQLIGEPRRSGSSFGEPWMRSETPKIEKRPPAGVVR
jgi:hypothetical protein